MKSLKFLATAFAIVIATASVVPSFGAPSATSQTLYSQSALANVAGAKKTKEEKKTEKEQRKQDKEKKKQEKKQADAAKKSASTPKK